MRRRADSLHLYFHFLLSFPLAGRHEPAGRPGRHGRRARRGQRRRQARLQDRVPAGVRALRPGQLLAAHHPDRRLRAPAGAPLDEFAGQDHAHRAFRRLLLLAGARLRGQARRAGPPVRRRPGRTLRRLRRGLGGKSLRTHRHGALPRDPRGRLPLLLLQALQPLVRRHRHEEAEAGGPGGTRRRSGRPRRHSGRP